MVISLEYIRGLSMTGKDETFPPHPPLPILWHHLRRVLRRRRGRFWGRGGCRLRRRRRRGLLLLGWGCRLHLFLWGGCLCLGLFFLGLFSLWSGIRFGRGVSLAQSGDYGAWGDCVTLLDVDGCDGAGLGGADIDRHLTEKTDSAS